MTVTWKDNGVPVTNALRILESLILDFEGPGRYHMKRWLRILGKELDKTYSDLSNPRDIKNLFDLLSGAIQDAPQPTMWTYVKCLHDLLNTELGEIGMVLVESEVVPYQGGENGGGKGGP